MFGKKKKNEIRNANDKSDFAIEYNIRVSKPYGYYPEDVEALIGRFKDSISTLEKENKILTDKCDELTKDKAAAESQLQQLVMQVSLMGFPDSSTAQDELMLGRLNTITGNMPDIVTPAEELSQNQDIPSIEIVQSSDEKSVDNLPKPNDDLPKSSKDKKESYAITENGLFDIIE